MNCGEGRETGTLSTTLELSELDSKIGQLFMVGIPGPHLDEGTENLIRDYNLGGVILFTRNIEGPVQLARLCRDLQDTVKKYQGPPLFLAVDQEGGRVARLREPFTIFPGNAAIGLNMDLAPVVDVQRGKPEKQMEGRIFGEGPEMAALLGRTVVRSLQENGVMAVAKHFPGLGGTRLDPHVHLPRIDMEIDEMEEGFQLS